MTLNAENHVKSFRGKSSLVHDAFHKKVRLEMFVLWQRLLFIAMMAMTMALGIAGGNLRRKTQSS